MYLIVSTKTGERPTVDEKNLGLFWLINTRSVNGNDVVGDRRIRQPALSGCLCKKQSN